VIRSAAVALARATARRLERAPVPTGRAWGAAFVVCASAPLGWQFPVVALITVVALVLVDGRLARREPALEPRAPLPRRLGQGQELDLAIELYDSGLRARPYELALEADPTLFEPTAFEFREGTTDPRRTIVERFQIRARRRGPKRLAALHLGLIGPLGLARVRERLALDLEVLVVPGLREVLAHQSRAALHLRRGLGRRRSRQRGEGGQFESLREYVRGDDPRHLDWKATARRGQPMVRRFEAERSQNVVLAIDCGRLMAERFEDLERLDHALASAVVLSRVAESWRDNVGLLAFADSVSHLMRPGSFPVGRLVEELSSVETRPVEPDYPRAILELSRELRRRSLIVVFTDLVDDEVSEPLAQNLAILARRHLPLLVAMRNPALFAAASETPTDRSGAYRRAAASELVTARRRSLERLRRAGVQVLDILPTDSVTAAVDAYLEIKLRGRL
jgi:uncharacterized protein (DUF58 family)